MTMTVHTLAYAGTTVTLPSALEWTDEFSWTDVVQTSTTLWGGGQWVQAARRLAGRQYTLDGSVTGVWVPRSTALVLRGWLQTLGLQMALSIRGAAPVQVVWDHDRGGLQVQPLNLLRGRDPLADDPCRVTVRFLGV